MPTTSNFGWTTPADTDLVKDGAAAIRTLGNGIDTSLVDLKGGTTGQVLSKASNTDLDFSWVAQDDSNAIQNALLTTTGDTIYASSASTPARLGIGTTGQVLTVSGGVPVWATPGGSGANWSLLNSGGTALTAASTITVSGISGVDKVMVLIASASTVNTNAEIRIRVNTNSGSIYYSYGPLLAWSQTRVAGDLSFNGGANTHIHIGNTNSNAAGTLSGGVTFTGCNTAGVKQYIYSGSGNAAGSAWDQYASWGQGYVDTSSTISSVSVISTSGNFDNGTIYVYTSA